MRKVRRSFLYRVVKVVSIFHLIDKPSGSYIPGVHTSCHRKYEETVFSNESSSSKRGVHLKTPSILQKTFLPFDFLSAWLSISGGPSLVSPHICIGTREDARNLEALKALGVTHVLNCAKQLPSSHPKEFVHARLDLVGMYQVHCTHVSDLAYSMWKGA